MTTRIKDLPDGPDAISTTRIATETSAEGNTTFGLTREQLLRLVDSLSFSDGSTQFKAATPDNFKFDLATNIFDSNFNYNTLSPNLTKVHALDISPAEERLMFLVDLDSKTLNRYKLPTKGGIKTAIFDSQLALDALLGDFPTGLTFSNKRDNAYMCAGSEPFFYQYKLNAPDVITGNPPLVRQSAPQDNDYQDVKMDSTDTNFFAIGKQNNKIYHFTLSTPKDISTLKFVSNASIPANANGLDISSDGHYIFIGTDTGLVTFYLSGAGRISTLGTGIITEFANPAGTLTGYTDGELITLSGGTGTGATATAVISGGTIQSVTLVSGGIDYTVDDTLVITGTTSSATTATIDADIINVETNNSQVGSDSNIIGFAVKVSPDGEYILNAGSSGGAAATNVIERYDLGIKVEGAIEGPLKLPYRTSSLAAETFNLSDSHVALSNTGARTIVIQTALLQAVGVLYMISDVADTAGGATITITTQGTETINGIVDPTSVSITANGGSFRFYSDGANYHEW